MLANRDILQHPGQGAASDATSSEASAAANVGQPPLQEASIDGAEYRFRVEAEGAVVERCVTQAPQVCVPAQLGGSPVVALGDESFALVESGGMSLKMHNVQLECVELPEGLRRIGRATFRGCSRLARVKLPESLVRVDDLAFSCTSVGAIRLPAACVRLSELALRTGPESLRGGDSPYLGKLDRIEVAPGNPRYCVSGGALCLRLDEGGLQALLCPGRADELRLGPEVVRIAPTAFAGTYEVGTLALCDSVAFDEGCGLPPQMSCRAVEITFAANPSTRLELAMPSKQLQRDIFESTAERLAFDARAFLAAYDVAVADEPDRLLQAKLMAARLARPLHLDAPTRASFTAVLESSFEAVCVHFGARNYWQGFDDLADAGLLDAAGIPRAISILSARADTTAVAYLLELKRARFTDAEKGGWDYDL